MNKALIWFAIAAVTYFIGGKLGLLLAIPPGFASAIWPASGVALACVLMGHRSAAIVGVGFGSFLVNASLASQNFNDITLQSILPALLIAAGAMSQVAVGSYLYLRFLGKSPIIDSPKNIIRFIGYVALGASLVAATVGVATLYGFDIISERNVVFSWTTWWIGDAIGVLLFAPLILIVFSKQEQLPSTRKWQIVFPTSLIFVGVLILFVFSTEQRHQQLETEINEAAQEFFFEFDRNLNAGIETLAGYAGLFSASDKVYWEDFVQFSEVVKNQREVFDGIGWTEIIDHEERIYFVDKTQKEFDSEFIIKEKNEKGEWIPAIKREQYFPVIYIYPLESNKAAVGFNLGSNNSRLQTLLKTKELSRPHATPPIRLVQEKGAGLSTIIYFPAVRNMTTRNMLTENKVFLGYVSGVIRIHRLLDDLIEKIQADEFDIKLTDVTDSNKKIEIVSPVDEPLTGFQPVVKQFNFAERVYEVEFFATSNFKIISKDWTSFTILTIGFIFAAILQAFILLLTGRTESIKLEVAAKTNDLLLATEAANKASRAKSEFTANISHELRTPLNAVIGMINQCLKTELNQAQRDYLKKAQLAGDTLKNIINSTLDFSKIEAGKLDIEYSPFNLPHLLNKLNVIFEPKAIESDLNFKVFLPEEFPVMIIGDQLRLEQVLLNLLGNAFKFTKEGEVKLELSIVSESESDVNLCFRVIDTGIGIPSEKQSALFDSFQQVDSSTSRKFGGTGLGLTITKKLLQLMNSDIAYESQEGKGSCFWFEMTFDLADGDRMSREEFEQQNNSPTEEVLSSAVSNEVLVNKRILIAEDVEFNQIIVEEILKEYKVNPVLVGNGFEAVELLKNDQAFDAILMDIHMPEMDGFEATSMIREQLKLTKIPIVAMTASAMKEDVERCLNVGMNSHVSKPIDEKLLISEITKLLS